MYTKSYRLNYQALYPEIEIGIDVLRVLRKTDRKMEYWEREVKRNQFRKRKTPQGFRYVIFPAREDSYDSLLEHGKVFGTREPSAEDQYMQQLECELLHICLSQLSREDKVLIEQLYFHGCTERAYAQAIGMTHQAVHKRKRKVLLKLRQMMKNNDNY